MMQGYMIWLVIAAGGAIGAMARHAVGQLAMRLLGPNFPWGTLTVNVLGSLAMGLVIAWLVAREPAGQGVRAFLAVGLLGAFTTFSTFALDAVTLYERKAMMTAGLYVGASVILSIVALFAGLAAGRSLFERAL
ncbi:fluoride efflux transporter CrcB [Aquisalinus luteolus]|nr:fluoride efflux transporter CrcB [Aquisalinus luteolus]